MKSLNTHILVLTFLYIFGIHSSITLAQHISHEAIPSPSDDFIMLLEGEVPVTHIDSIDQFNPGHTHQVPWSDSYWPIYKGLIATRYQMSNHPNSGGWSTYYNHYQNHPAHTLIRSGRIDELSPAEKYDLLIGDSSWSLTQYMWNRGRTALNKHGAVASWTGICHGWAAASQLGIPRAQTPITMTDVTGQHQIHFTIFDLTALTSYYWSKSGEKSFFVGNRCKSHSPRRNENGRVVDEKCFDNNPMTWHLGVTNRVGKVGKSIIMDTSVDSEVWNYVVDNYHFIYFNPQSLEFSSQLQDAIVQRADFRHDRFQATRAPETVFIVGVIMDVFHPGAISPHKGTPSLQLMERKRFIYDLELDQNKNVIGGEWHSLNRPDFLWGYSELSNPFLHPQRGDFIGELNTKVAEAAKSASHRGRVFGPLLNMLIAKSNGVQFPGSEIGTRESHPHSHDPREYESTDR